MHRRRSSQRRPIRRRFCIEGLFFTVLGLALAYGTALGLARDRDMIEADDDVDVIVPGGDFARAEDVMRNAGFDVAGKWE